MKQLHGWGAGVWVVSQLEHCGGCSTDTRIYLMNGTSPAGMATRAPLPVGARLAIGLATCLAPLAGGAPSAAQSDACNQGYFWRMAFAADHLCVTAATRDQVAADNAAAAERRAPGGGDSCNRGFVWRMANPQDHVCVTPLTRQQTQQDNNAATLPVRAAEATTIAACPSQATIPVKFVVDCSHVKDAETRQLCAPFIANQACKVFPAYRKITGIRLEQRCPTISYTIYDKDNFPHGGGAGGMSYNCQIDHMAQYALQQWADSKIGPYEDHEILHHYQMTSKELEGMTAAHPLFEPSMAEAQREVGDDVFYNRFLGYLKNEMPQLRAQFQKGTVKPADQCKLARVIIAGELYLEDRQNAYQFYSRLASVAPKDVADRDARFNAMLNDVSGGKAKEFLTSHGCAPF